MKEIATGCIRRIFILENPWLKLTDHPLHLRHCLLSECLLCATTRAKLSLSIVKILVKTFYDRRKKNSQCSVVCFPKTLDFCLFKESKGFFLKFSMSLRVKDLSFVNHSEWLVSNFYLQYHHWIKRWGHENKGNDHQLKRLFIL